MHVYVFLCVCSICVSAYGGQKREGVESPGCRLTGGCEAFYMGVELNLDSGQQLLF